MRTWWNWKNLLFRTLHIGQPLLGSHQYTMGRRGVTQNLDSTKLCFMTAFLMFATSREKSCLCDVFQHDSVDTWISDKTCNRMHHFEASATRYHQNEGVMQIGRQSYSWKGCNPGVPRDKNTPSWPIFGQKWRWAVKVTQPMLLLFPLP